MLARLLLILVWMAAAALAKPIEVALFEGGEGVEFYQQVAAQLTRQRPDLPIRIEADPAISDRLRIRVLEGRLPEVTNANLDIWSLIKHDKLLPLDPWLDQAAWDGQGTWRESFLPGALDQFRRGGKTYGVPLVYTIWSVYYDKALFAREGWSPPRTWSEFLSLCDRMQARGLAPLAFQGRYAYYAEALVRHTFYHLAGPEAYARQLDGEPGSYDNPAMIAALEMVGSLARQHFQKGFSGMSHTEAQLELFQGRAGMLMCGSWLYSEMQANIPAGYQLGAFPLPLPEGSSRSDPGAGYVTTDGFWFVFKDSANPAGGVEFLRYLTSAQVAGRFAGERGITVVIGKANQQLHPMVGDVARQLGGVQRTFSRSSADTVAEAGQVWNDALSLLLNEPECDARTVATMMETRIQRAREARLHPDQVEVRHPLKTIAFLLFLLLGLLLSVRWKGAVQASGRYRKRDLLLFLGPALSLYGLFFLLPSLLALLAGASRWDGLGSPEWVGTLNFRRLLLESDAFWVAFANNVYLMLVIPSLVLPLSLLLANALHQGVRGSRVLRIGFFFPNLLGVAGILLWQQLYNPAGGPINAALSGLGLRSFEGFPWLAPQNLYTALIPMGLWGACGFNMVLLLAAMQGVPRDLYEAAELYGAGAWQKFRFITLPLIWPTVIAAFLFMVIGAMKAFEVIWLLTNQAPTTETHVLGTLMVRSMFVEHRVGQAAAMACLLFAVVLVCSLLAERILSREET
jgi:raffinose/stachyose/melibiose transport system permease protein